MYSAPTTFIAVNTASERATSTPTPRAMAATCTHSPDVLPTTVASAARRPSEMPRLTTKSTLGPGSTMSAQAVAPNVTSCRPVSSPVSIATA